MTPLDLLIIGGGPAGLSAAIEARRLGVKNLLVVERESEAGGAVRHCGHLGFGMFDLARFTTGPRYAALLRQRAEGVPIALNSAVTTLLPGGEAVVSTPLGEARMRARRILLATGIRETPRSARLITGTRPFGVLTTGALQRFVYLEKRLPCRNPVVIGSELVAFSTLLTLRHGGVRPAAILEETAAIQSPFPAKQVSRLLFGTPVLTGTRLLAIHGTQSVEAVTIEQRGETRSITCDAVIFTGRWVPEAGLMRAHPAGIDPETLGPRVDAELRTADPQVYAAGNVLYSVRSSGPVALEGRHAARMIAADLSSGR